MQETTGCNQVKRSDNGDFSSHMPTRAIQLQTNTRAEYRNSAVIINGVLAFVEVDLFMDRSKDTKNAKPHLPKPSVT